MKAVLVLLFSIMCYVECRKTYAPIDKNANLAFINMEGGGLAGQPAKSNVPAPVPVPSPVTQPPKSQAQATSKPAVSPVQPTAVKPSQPAPHKPVPVNPAPAPTPITTPGPGSVKQLVNFYDSQGKKSLIRPYSYSEAVKQG